MAQLEFQQERAQRKAAHADAKMQELEKIRAAKDFLRQAVAVAKAAAAAREQAAAKERAAASPLATLTWVHSAEQTEGVVPGKTATTKRGHARGQRPWATELADCA